MNHNLFKPQNIEDAKNCVVGDCNGFSMEERYRVETPLFAKAILENIKFIAGGVPDKNYAEIVDYGCGCGRLAKEILNQCPSLIVHGVDASAEMLKLAVEDICNSGHFHPSLPTKINMGQGNADLVYCVYVLQHAPSIEIREILQRIYYNLKDDGVFIYCSSDYRMSIRFDGQGFFDDRFLGVNLQEEVERYFVKVKPLFSDEVLNANPLLGKMIRGDNGGLAHPAYVYRKRTLEGPLFNATQVLVSGLPLDEEADKFLGNEVKFEEPNAEIKLTGTIKKGKPFISEIEVKKEYKKLVLINRLAPGDILVSTNALRDLHKAYPGKYQTEMRTPCNNIFDNNPYITKLQYDENEYQKCERELHSGGKDGSTFVLDGDILVIDLHYPIIHESGLVGHHFSYGHTMWLEEVLGISIKKTDIRPEIYLSQSEKDWISPVLSLTGDDSPYWCINAGSKGDYTLKQYPYYQEVVNILKDRVKFVQIGLEGHNHIPLNGTINMVGRTNDSRQLFRVINNSLGVLTPVSFAMHISAAFNKPTVVVAGGRESVRWEYYQGHRYINTNGLLPCCIADGCWKSKLEDCVNKVGNIAKCMKMISPEMIVNEIESFYTGGILHR